MTPKVTVSHSEVNSIVVCERQHYYAYGEKIAAKKKSAALERGITGHELMQTFFESFKRTGSFTSSLTDVTAEAADRMNPDNIPKIAYLISTITSFLLTHRERIEKWTLLHIEETFKLDLGYFIYAFTPDLIIKENGVIVVLDWKFVYDFYDDTMVDLSPQLPRYIGALRALDIPVARGLYAFLRYRNVKDEGEGNRFKLQDIAPTNTRINNSFTDLTLSVKPVAAKKEMSLADWSLSTRRAGNQTVCKSCDFKTLCVAELNGSDGKLIRHTQFERSTYGYEESNV